MIEEMYYMLVGFALIFLFLIIYFSEVEYYKRDKHGREWDASVFIVAPLCVMNLILLVILAYESWNIEIIDYSTSPVTLVATEEMGYFAMVFFGLVLITIALLVKSVFKFFIESAEEPS